MTFPTTPRPVRARAVRRWAGAAAVVVTSSLVLAGGSDDPTPVAKSICAVLSDWLPKTTGSMIMVDGGVHALGV